MRDKTVPCRLVMAGILLFLTTVLSVQKQNPVEIWKDRKGRRIAFLFWEILGMKVHVFAVCRPGDDLQVRQPNFQYLNPAMRSTYIFCRVIYRVSAEGDRRVLNAPYQESSWWRLISRIHTP